MQTLVRDLQMNISKFLLPLGYRLFDLLTVTSRSHGQYLVQFMTTEDTLKKKVGF